MSSDDRRGGDVSPSRRPPDMRMRIAVGAVGAAAVLGVGAYTITSHLTARDSTVKQDARALAPFASPSGPGSVVSPSGSVAQATAESVPSAATNSTSFSPKVKKEIDEAHAHAKNKVPVTKPLPPPPKVLPDSAVSTQIKTTKDAYLRITTAHADLTDQKDQRMAADQGTRAGHANCTQHFHFASNVKAKVIPNMMICWRVSAKKSVVTLGVTYKGKPSAETYAKVIDREWAKLR